MYYIGLVLAVGSMVGGAISFFFGAGMMALAVILLSYILMVLLDFADAYIEAHGK